MATLKQLNLIKSLIAQREVNEFLQSKIEQARARAIEGVLSIGEASALIDLLMNAPMASLEGMHQLPTGEIYKVQRAVHGSGFPYAKLLTITDGTAYFSIARGAMRFLSQATRMSTEQAAHFGHLYGICCNCGRTLTDEDSIARGIGPICAQNFA